MDNSSLKTPQKPKKVRCKMDKTLTQLAQQYMDEYQKRLRRLGQKKYGMNYNLILIGIGKLGKYNLIGHNLMKKMQN